MRTPFKHTPLYRWHEQHKATFVTVAGWEIVVDYGDAANEISTLTSAAAIRDVTPLAKCLVQGKHSASHVRDVLSLTEIPGVGACAAGKICEKACPVSVLRISGDRFLTIASSKHQQEINHVLSQSIANETCVHVTDVTSAYAAFYLVGPKAIEVLKRCTSAPIESIRSRQCLQSPTARVWSLLLRDDNGAWLILVSRDFGEYVWRSILAEGHEFGIGVFGERAAQSLSSGAFNVAAV